MNAARIQAKRAIARGWTRSKRSRQTTETSSRSCLQGCIACRPAANRAPHLNAAVTGLRDMLGDPNPQPAPSITPVLLRPSHDRQRQEKRGTHREGRSQQQSGSKRGRDEHPMVSKDKGRKGEGSRRRMASGASRSVRVQGRLCERGKTSRWGKQYDGFGRWNAR